MVTYDFGSIVVRNPPTEAEHLEKWCNDIEAYNGCHRCNEEPKKDGANCYTEIAEMLKDDHYDI